MFPVKSFSKNIQPFQSCLTCPVLYLGIISVLWDNACFFHFNYVCLYISIYKISKFKLLERWFLYQPSAVIFTLECYMFFLYSRFLSCSFKKLEHWNSLKIWVIYLYNSVDSLFPTFLYFPHICEYLVIGKCHQHLVTRYKVHFKL